MNQYLRSELLTVSTAVLQALIATGEYVEPDNHPSGVIRRREPGAPATASVLAVMLAKDLIDLIDSHA